MTTHICTWDDPSGEPSELDLLRDVVVRHIVDGQTSGNPTAAALAQSLVTELDAAGLDITTWVNAHRGDLADEHRAAGA